MKTFNSEVPVKCDLFSFISIAENLKQIFQTLEKYTNYIIWQVTAVK